MVKITKFILFNTHHYNKMQNEKENKIKNEIIYTESFPNINGGTNKKQAGSSYLSLRGMSEVPYNHRTFDYQSGEFEIFYMMKTSTGTDMCCIRLCNLAGSSEIKITYFFNNVRRDEIHYFDPYDFFSNVNKYLLKEKELEDQQRVLADREFVGYT